MSIHINCHLENIMRTEEPLPHFKDFGCRKFVHVDVVLWS